MSHETGGRAMSAPVDTAEAVEARAKWYGTEDAAMLRRLHARAVEAERERDELIHDNATLMDGLNAAEAALATARADALREAQRVCDKHARFAAQGGPHTCDTTNGALWYGREQYARLCANEIGALIPSKGDQ